MTRIEKARKFYEEAVFGGDAAAIAAGDRELDSVEADLALARGRLVHARFLDDRNADPVELELFERAARLYQTLGDVRGEAEALFWIGIYHQVVRGENDDVVGTFERSYELAKQAGDELTMSYAVRHLGFAAMAAGDLPIARERLEESVRIRREIGFSAGVAAGLLALADLAAEEGRRDEALTLLDEASEAARSCDAHGVLRWVEGTRAQL